MTFTFPPGQPDASSNVKPAVITTPTLKRHLATQTEFPKRTAIRTGIATVVLFLVAAAAASPIIGPFIDRYIPGAGAGVLAFGVFCGLLVGLLNRLANLKPVAQLLTRLGLGPVPKS